MRASSLVSARIPSQRAGFTLIELLVVIAMPADLGLSSKKDFNKGD